MKENRRVKREPMQGISTLVHRPDGSVLEGVLKDVSDGGVKIGGDTTGLHIGDAIDVFLVIQGQKVRYTCEVRHIEAPDRSYGVHFRSGPNNADGPAQKVKRCMQCSRNFPQDCRYCSQCGQRLVTR